MQNPFGHSVLPDASSAGVEHDIQKQKRVEGKQDSKVADRLQEEMEPVYATPVIPNTA